MDWLQILVLALIQGLTEFLPISSSAHLILSPYLFGFPDQGLAFDVAVHLGSLGAVMAYFWPELQRIALAMLGQAVGRSAAAEARLGWLIVLATVPVVVAGLLMKGLIETEFRSPLLIAGTTIAFGLALLWADLMGHRQRDEHSLSLRDALVIGLMQALALVPGTSRSGITMTAGLMLGLTREAAARFSFLLSIPTILLSGGLVTLELITSEALVDWLDLFLALCLSFLAAYACIALFLKVIERIGMLPFVIYRLVLGVVIITLAL